MGGHAHSPEAMPKDDQNLDELKKHLIPIDLRDKCAHLLVPLNVCRRETWFNPDKCTHQRHIYEECQYICWTRRKEKKEALVKAKKEAALSAA
mmetsp:Transcript_21225/g.44336  ORF Transcript_21225/g.44336 Transcript_21225/m.44336 type:complete len:93 (+) Transcript_21225:75-353(+)|eukprot:CAMPEP_0172455938 /NCGR_PEP_ID=MMETSP1065-20121228/13203_1 /TAXON_ID=265537 /ORGANISM="Amphiprora paludosa, Strain CCMP125" /LENGTH=92 /DNA_ID=CAMNT_0013208487 /DNA_START=56 /DNA_END=334 /DNA_ORIENTATION=+